jgi:hypothetical protein
MEEIVKSKILFLEAILKEINQEYDEKVFLTTRESKDYQEECLVYEMQIKILKQVLKEFNSLTK